MDKYQLYPKALWALADSGCGISVQLLSDAADHMSVLQCVCHTLARRAGWWDEFDAMPEQYRKYFLGTKRDLIHSELAEATEGARKNAMDDHLPHRKSEEVELADAIIRIFDYAEQQKLDLSRALIDKLAYNLTRADHTREARAAKGGKSV